VKYQQLLNTSIFWFLASTSQTVLADGLAELKANLVKFKGNTPISATVESSYTEKRGKKNKLKTKSGLVQVNLTNTEQGLKLIYSNDTLEKLNLEAEQKENNDEVDTPTLNAIGDIDVEEMSKMLSAAPSLLRFINKATFTNEQTVIYQNENLRQLNFTLPLEAIIENKEVHEYVDDFTGNYQIIIDENGIPLESQVNFDGSGSAYIFFSMDIMRTSTFNYQLIGERLVNVRKTFEYKSDSTWGKTESSGYKILIVNPNDSAFASLH